MCWAHGLLFVCFLAALGLHCSTRAFSSCREQGLLSSWCVRASRRSGFSRFGAPALEHRLSSCGTWPQLLRGGRNLPGIKLMSLHWEVDSFFKIFYIFKFSFLKISMSMSPLLPSGPSVPSF